MSCSECERLRTEVARLTGRCKELSDKRDDARAEAEGWGDEAAALRTRVAELEGLLRKYGGHRNDEVAFCESLKHSDYPCTCGFDAALTPQPTESSTVMLDIVFDKMPGPEGCTFVETEVGGWGVGVGEWVSVKDGYSALRIEVPESIVRFQPGAASLTPQTAPPVPCAECGGSREVRQQMGGNDYYVMKPCPSCKPAEPDDAGEEGR